MSVDQDVQHKSNYTVKMKTLDMNEKICEYIDQEVPLNIIKSPKNVLQKCLIVLILQKKQWTTSKSIKKCK